MNLKHLYLIIISLIYLPPLLAEHESPTYGFVEPLEGAQCFHAQSGRRVACIFVKEGDSVKAGQLLAKLDCEREMAEFAIVKAKAEVVRTNYEIAKDLLRRHEELYSQDVISEHQVTQTRLKSDCALACLEVARCELELAEIKLKDFEVHSPCDGKLYRFGLRQGGLVRCIDEITVGNPHLGVRMWTNPLGRDALEGDQVVISLACKHHEHPALNGRIIRRSLYLTEKNPASPNTVKGERFQELVVELEDSDCPLPIGALVIGSNPAHP